jgi:ATP-binding cassette, subfamily B, bacterial
MSRWWLRLAPYARPHGQGIVILLLLTFVGVGLSALMPWPLKLIVDYVLTARPLPGGVAWIALLPGGGAPTAVLMWLALATLLLALARQTAALVEAYVQVRVGNRMLYALGAELFDHLQRLSVRYHSRAHVGDLVRRVTTDSSCIRDLAIGVALPALTSLTSLAVMFAIMWQLDRTLALVAILVAVPLGLIMRVTGPRMMQRTYQQQVLEGQVMARAEQTLSALPVVQAFGREEHEDRRFVGLASDTIQAYLRALVAQLQFKIGVDSTMAIGTAAIIGFGGLQVLQGSLTVGSLLVFLAYLAALYAPMQTLAHLATSFASAAARAQRVFEVLDAAEVVRDAPGARPLPPRPMGRRGHVRLEGVTFGYEPDRPVLEDASLEARPGETVALVGRTGAGKSTLVSLIPRFVDPWRGRVVLDGFDVRDLQLASLRAEIALVLQEPFLLPLSVADNIAYGRTGGREGEITAAAVAANADEFIRRLPAGYETMIGERGATLSGGERQRLAIARALLKDAPVLILDEPTSALDAETEALLLEALARLMRGRTTFLIAHRLSTVREADRIVVLEGGRVAETGSHEELMRRGGRYVDALRAQLGKEAQSRFVDGATVLGGSGA